MPLIKRRPDIRLFAPRVASVGTPFEVKVELHAKAPVPVDAVKVTLEAMATFDGHEGQIRLVRAVASVWPGGEVPKGLTALRARFVLPPGTPPTHVGRFLHVRYEFEVHVDIPWWPDARRTFVQHVAPGSGSNGLEAERRPHVWVSKLEGPRDARPYLEASLASPLLRPGGDLRGSVAFAHTDRFEYKGLRFDLIRYEGLGERKRPNVAHEARIRSYKMPLTEVHEQRPTMFLLRLPSQTFSPGFEHPAAFSQWVLEISADVPWARDPKLRIPLVVATTAHDPQKPLPEPVPVGTDRLALVWQYVAERTGLRWRDEHLDGTVGRVRVDLRREQSQGKLQIVARIEPRDDIGLRATAARGWRGAGAVSARDDAHAHQLAEHFVPVMAEHAETLRCSGLEGAALRFETNTAGVRQRDVMAAAMAAVALARRLDEAYARMGTPADLDGEAAVAWEASAAALRGRFIGPAVRIEAPLSLHHNVPGGSEGQLEIGRTRGADDRVASIEVRLVSPVALDRRQHLTWARGDAVPPRPPMRSPGEEDPLAGLDHVWRAASTFFVDDTGLRLTLPPDTSPREAVNFARALSDGLDRILGGAGPYR